LNMNKILIRSGSLRPDIPIHKSLHNKQSNLCNTETVKDWMLNLHSPRMNPISSKPQGGQIQGFMSLRWVPLIIA
jgi:hypothetical protein